MRIITFRGESSIGDLVDKAYTKVTPEARKAAETAFLRANPRLGSLETMKAGTVLVVPDLPRLTARRGENLEDPLKELSDRLIQDLRSFLTGVAEHHDAHLADLKGEVGLLKEPQLRRVVESSPSLRALLREATESVEARVKAARVEQGRFESAMKIWVSNLPGR